MARLIRWQTFFAALGILVIGGLLAQFSFSRQIVILPARGGIYTEGVVGAPQFLNPFLAASDADRAISGLLFEGLSYLQADGSVAPALAETWEIAPGGTVYTFTLRSDARWHDGEAVTTEDFLFTLDLIRAPAFSELPFADLWSRVQAQALDEYRLRFELERLYAPFLSYTNLPVLPAHLLQGITPADLTLSAFNLNPVGTGPFRFVEILEEDTGALLLDLEANPFYYGPTPYLERIQFRFYRAEADLTEALLLGEVNGAFGLSPEAQVQVSGQPDLITYRTYLQAYTILFLNSQTTLMLDGRIRQAIVLGLDLAALVEGLGEDIFLANGPISPISWAYKADLPPFEYDFTQAAHLLEESGWYDQDEDGIREQDLRSLELTLLTRNVPEERHLLAHRIKQQLAPLGITIRVLSLDDPDVYRERLENRDFDLLLYGWGQLGRDPDEFVLWHSSQIGPQGFNFSSFQDEDVDLLLQRGRTTLDQDTRTWIYWQFQELFMQKAPAVPLYYPVYTFVAQSRIRGVELTPFNDVADRFHSVTNWYVKTQKVITGRNRSATRYEGGEQP